ncbi:DegT/DnrJ/EryC1/StrS family aminotransferase [Streptomyces sp. NPDC003077]|uniref:DegT/DnrJ/EryC1/StrS family aminotransferase n=1 Tax=Streptomyces sp. NPDC003077 TaxID=3154443 RepID=UPI0033AA2085
MYPPKKFDITWPDLAFGLAACGRDHDADQQRMAAAVEQRFADGSGAGTGAVRRFGGHRPTRWSGGGDGADSARADSCLATLSVRSALDLCLTASGLPPGSEVLMSAVTIPDMWQVVREHGLVPVPVDIEPGTLLPRPEQWLAAATPRTKAVIVAHLLGTQAPLDDLVTLAQERGWLLVEDCAQAYSGPSFRGDPGADLTLFSFGPIKTATALGGALAVVRDAALLASMRELHRSWPVQKRSDQAGRIAKYGWFALLTERPVYTGVTAAARLLGIDPGDRMQSTVGAFAGRDLMPAIRHRPSPALLALLERRLRADTATSVTERAETARRLVSLLPTGSVVYGAEAPVHTYWLCAVPTRDPAATAARLRAAGFDATRPTSLAAVPAPAGREPGARTAAHLVRHAVCLPFHPGMPDRALERMAAVVDPEMHGLKAVTVP